MGRARWVRLRTPGWDRGLRLGNVEIIGWGQIREALNTSQVVPVLACRHWVTSGGFWALEGLMYCLFSLLAWDPNKRDIRFSLIIEQLNTQPRNYCPQLFVKSTDPGLCSEKNLTHPRELVPASYSCSGPKLLLFVLTIKAPSPIRSPCSGRP